MKPVAGNYTSEGEKKGEASLGAGTAALGAAERKEKTKKSRKPLLKRPSEWTKSLTIP